MRGAPFGSVYRGLVLLRKRMFANRYSKPVPLVEALFVLDQGSIDAALPFLLRVTSRTRHARDWDHLYPEREDKKRAVGYALSLCTEGDL